MKNPLKTYSRIFSATIVVAVIAYLLSRGYTPAHILGIFLYSWGVYTLFDFFMRFILRKGSKKKDEVEKEDADTLAK